MAAASPTPLGAVTRGLIAGVTGTALMTAWQELSAKLISSDEEESSEEPSDPWEEAPAPAKVAQRFVKGMFGKDLSAESIPVATNAMHWGYGTGWGIVYGLVAGTRGRSRLGGGLAFGTAVWLASYAQLVPMGLYEPPWTYEPGELALDLSYHLAYGAGVAGGYAAVS